jgi:DNA polymerase III subunit epsilon
VRQIVFDTETTGLDVNLGHRVIEIGCVELSGRAISTARYHCYVNPERDSDPEAFKVHRLSTEFLREKPKFAEQLEPFLQFINGAELLVHNAAFDVGMIDAELARCADRVGEKTKLADYCQITDTLLLARRLYPGQRNSLDALCKRLEIDNSHRTAHGALLDAELLAEVYLAMTRGQDALGFQERTQSAASDVASAAFNGRLLRQFASADEQAEHMLRLQAVEKASKGNCIWQRSSQPVASKAT